jgi:hypothetical protein
MFVTMKQLDTLRGVWTVHFSRSGWNFGDGLGTWNHATVVVRAQNRREARRRAWPEFHRAMRGWGPLAKKDGWRVLAVQLPDLVEYASIGIFVKYAREVLPYDLPAKPKVDVKRMLREYVPPLPSPSF